MKIYIEFVVLIMVLGAYFIIKWKLERGRKKALKRYDPSKDMSGEFHKLQNGNNQKGGVFESRPDEGTDKGIDTIVDNPIRPNESEGRELLYPPGLTTYKTNTLYNWLGFNWITFDHYISY
jgi:hypothetical protein